MQIARLLSLAALTIALSVQAASLSGARLESGGAGLVVVQDDGSTFHAPKIEDQDSFRKPRVAADHRHVGWLALFPDRGASYSQPLYLVVLDASRQLRRFSGDFGMVFDWCFTKSSDAVVYRYQFPHGLTSTGFDMRRLSDGKLLRRALLDPIDFDDDETQVIRKKAPLWTRCAQERAGSE